MTVFFYSGLTDGDAKGAFLRVRSTDLGVSFSPSKVVSEPLLFTADRADTTWLGDYVGLAWSSGSLYASFTDNRAGTHIAFARVTP